MPVLIHRQGTPSPRISNRRVQALVEGMLTALNCKESELSILLCDDRIIRGLNERYRSKPQKTDVLAFPDAPATKSGTRPRTARTKIPSILGDVAISLQTAQEQAKSRGVPLLDEVMFLLAHGLLHLMGMDHDTPLKAATMNRRTVALLTQIGFSTPKGAVARAPRQQKTRATATRRRPRVRGVRVAGNK